MRLQTLDQIAKTKILTTLGPATDSLEQLEKLVDAGADAFRLNFSHGSYEYFETLFKKIDELCKKKSLPIAILIDLQGPKIRIGELEEEKILISSGDQIEITIDKIKGTKEKVSTSYDLIVNDASVGDKILIDDGLLELKVKEKKERSLICDIVEGGYLKPRKGMNLPGMKLSTPSLTEKDKADIKFAIKHRVDFIALSFVRNPKDIIDLRKILKENNKKIPIIAKIEKPEAVKNLDEIVDEADGVMVARGDLGVEMDPQEVPLIQKKLIRKARSLGKLVITATQMLESMVNNPVPTRAEASDVANAVWDGTDVVMLSAETSVGKYPIEAVETMNKILLNTEAHAEYNSNIEYKIPEDIVDNLFDAAGAAVCCVAKQIEASLIVIFTHFGRKARIISKYRPDQKIIAIADKFETLNRLNLYYGVIPFFVDEFVNADVAIRKANEILLENELVKKDDVLIYTAGAPITDTSRKNWMQFSVVE